MSEPDWIKTYGILRNITPLPSDCGRICGKKCCSAQTGSGIYLFPGEEDFFRQEESWCNVQTHPEGVQHFTGRGTILLSCNGICPREKRPLACRLFPLAPYLDKSGSLEIRFDKDLLFICPLVRLGDIDILNPAFRDGVRQVWEELLKNSRILENVRLYSARIDENGYDLWEEFFYPHRK